MEISMTGVTPSTWITGSFYNITVTRENNNMKYYVNGVLIKTLLSGENYQIPDATPFDRLVLNSYRPNAGIPNSGSYLDISIFDGVLSPTTVSGYYDSLKTKWGI